MVLNYKESFENGSFNCSPKQAKIWILVQENWSKCCLRDLGGCLITGYQ